MDLKNEHFHLNNGDSIIVRRIFHHYVTNDVEYLITNSNNQDYLINKSELINLISHRRSTSEKLALFMKYFAGRSDVYAQKWSNGKGYSPALKNWWDFYQLRNDKAAQKRLAKEYDPYTKRVVYEQITSDDQYHRYGIYPLLKGDLTKLLVFDFDKHQSTVNPQRTTISVLKTCQKYQIDCLPEISSSGNSYHLWIFFSEPIKANLARLSGKLLLFEAMVNDDSVSIESFDRMIPNQDHLPKKGFGNLIALPLKWADVRNNCSIFTDDQLRPLLPSQLFDRLESTARYSLTEVQSFCDAIKQDMRLMTGENDKFNWSQLADFPRQIIGKIAGEIMINRAQLTRRQQLSLLGLATFANPEFIKKQRMRMPVWNTPSYLTAASIDNEFLRLPRGILQKLKQFSDCQLSVNFTKVPEIDVNFRGKLREEQQSSVKALRSHNLGIICAHTGFGKTVVGCYLIAKRHARTLVIVPTTNIAKQWQHSADKFLEIKNHPFVEKTPTGRIVKKQKTEMITGARDHPSHLVDIINIRKIARMNQQGRSELFQHYSQVIVDECHHISAITFEKVLKDANTKYIVGLTATPERSDGLQQFVYYRCGDIVYRGGQKENVLIHRYLYPRYSGFGEVVSSHQNLNYAAKITQLVNDEDRNNEIVNDVIGCFQEGRHMLLLSDRIKHLQTLKRLIGDRLKQKNVYLITGGTKGSLNVRTGTKNPYLILSTNKYVGEGFDLPSLDTLFLTLPFSWKGNTTQYLGRLERDLSHKDELRVYDYIDIADETFAKMYRKRVPVYKKLGYEFVQSTGERDYCSAYYTRKDYKNSWETDFSNADNIFMQINKPSNRLIEKMNLAASLNKHVVLITPKQNQEHISKNLLSPAIKVQFKDISGNNITIFDDRIFWYGDLNFEGHSFEQMSAIRIVSKNVVRKINRL